MSAMFFQKISWANGTLINFGRIYMTNFARRGREVKLMRNKFLFFKVWIVKMACILLCLLLCLYNIIWTFSDLTKCKISLIIDVWCYTFYMFILRFFYIFWIDNTKRVHFIVYCVKDFLLKKRENTPKDIFFSKMWLGYVKVSHCAMTC